PRWTPAARVGASAVGGAAVANGLRKEGPAGWMSAAAGAALLLRAATNRTFADTFGIGSSANAVHIDKSVHLAAPLEAVYAFWADFENFPRFMSHLKEVRNLGNGRSHWVAEGPGRIAVAWDAEITTQAENAKLAWRSVPGSHVRTAGEV